jgi:uncharacterized protein YjiS (DUF1127 family)
MEVAMTAIAKIAKPRIIDAASVVRALVALAALVAYRAGQALAARKHRSDVALLARADDRMLADVGLTRSDVRDAVCGPLWQDPTILLRTRALERRLSRSGVTHGLQPDELPSRVCAPSISPADEFQRPSTERPARLAL